MSAYYLIFGGTGSLGKTLVKRLLEDKTKRNKVYVFARGEDKHHRLKLQYPEVHNILGDIRDYDSVLKVINTVEPDYIINAAALKQVPLCEEYPFEAVQTNTLGAQNLTKALDQYKRKVIKALFISTDKACKPVNSYGMTKSLAERIHLNGQGHHIHNCVRYGNVLESTGSVIPVFKQKLLNNQNLQITHPLMTRFLLSLDQAVNLIFEALADHQGKKVFIPKIPSALIADLAELFIEKSKKDCKIEITNIRPGEKLHEIMISEEELIRTEELEDKYIINDINTNSRFTQLNHEYSSSNGLMTKQELDKFLEYHGAYKDL